MSQDPRSASPEFQDTVVLIGMMGAGKSTVGAKLANILRCSFTDLDLMIEDQDEQKRTVPTIINEDGLPRFRQKETEALRSWLSQNEPGVLATGGGVIVTPENRALLCSSNHSVIWLSAPVEVLLQRTSGAQQHKRPLLQDASDVARQRRLEELLEERETWYRSCCSTIIDCEEKSPEEIAQEITQQTHSRPQL